MWTRNLKRKHRLKGNLEKAKGAQCLHFAKGIFFRELCPVGSSDLGVPVHQFVFFPC